MTSSGFLPAVGAKGGIDTETGAYPFRLEIRELYQDRDMFNLFLLGLERYYQVPVTDRKSYYQIAGIHGRPAQPWDGVPGRNGARAAGYCTHSSILFPTWHRPYLAVYEQCLWEHVQAAANEFPVGHRYRTIAPNFRIPYWDWASDPTLPSWVLTERTIQVTKPTGVVTIPNPLFSYRFQTRSAFPTSPWNTWVETVRNPLDRNPNPRSNPANVNRAMNNNFFNFKDRTFELLTGDSSYTTFSNTAIHGNGTTGFDSIEGIHDSVHGNTGLGGHMGVVDYSAFDPIFWLHHTNIDRLTAIWQVLWPNSWVTPQRATRETFTQAANTIENINTELRPFRSSQTRFWTSATMRNLKDFGSVYPELVDWGEVQPEEFRGNVIAALNRLYNAAGPANILRRLRQTSSSARSALASIVPSGIIPQTDGPDDEKEEEEEDKPTEPEALTTQPGPSSYPTTYAPPPGDAPNEPVQYDDYSVLIRVKKHAVKTSFFVHVFLGDFNPDPTTWNTERSLVGSHYVLVSPIETTECGKCKEEEEIVVNGKIPLTGAILDHFSDEDLHEDLSRENVINYLKRHLHWRITRGDPESTPVERGEIPSLKIAVRVRTVEDDGDERTLPVYGEPEVLTEVTKGRPCGYGEGDDL